MFFRIQFFPVSIVLDLYNICGDLHKIRLGQYLEIATKKEERRVNNESCAYDRGHIHCHKIVVPVDMPSRFTQHTCVSFVQRTKRFFICAHSTLEMHTHKRGALVADGQNNQKWERIGGLCSQRWSLALSNREYGDCRKKFGRGDESKMVAQDCTFSVPMSFFVGYLYA